MSPLPRRGRIRAAREYAQGVRLPLARVYANLLISWWRDGASFVNKPMPHVTLRPDAVSEVRSRLRDILLEAKI